MNEQEFTNETKFLTQSDLAKRWGVAKNTLEKRRWRGEAPAFFRIAGRVRYSLADIEAYEAQNRVHCNVQEIDLVKEDV